MNLIFALTVSISCSMLFAQVTPPPDVGKREVELPAEMFLAAQTLSAPAKEDSTLLGLVRWHANLKAAADSSAESGKPLLRFQLLGRLDERFT
ncbi:MAG TPA: hypothetical protein PKA37_10265 [Planctomycetota bacterium]|jgi:hypothetical protein|nr:hypothetical protein [Planctomycetota bacterium]